MTGSKRKAGRSKGSTAAKKTTPKGGHRKAKYSKEELSLVLAMTNKGKTHKQIAAKLWKEKLSPFKRSPQAINNCQQRILKGVYEIAKKRA